MSYLPKFKNTHPIAAGLTKIEQARGFLETAKLSDDWIPGMQNRALLPEAYHTAHIEGTHLRPEPSKRFLSGKKVTSADPDDIRELLNYRSAFNLATECLDSGEAITG